MTPKEAERRCRLNLCRHDHGLTNAQLIKWRKIPRSTDAKGSGKSGAAYRVFMGRETVKRGKLGWFYEVNSSDSSSGRFESQEEAKNACADDERNRLAAGMKAGTPRHTATALQARVDDLFAIERARPFDAADLPSEHLKKLGLQPKEKRVKTKDGIHQISIASIKTRGLPKPDPEHVASLVASIEEIELLNPITVDKDGNLIAGAHRLAAYKKLGHKTIPANIVDLDKLGLELARIDENLIRKVGTALERADMLEDRKRLYELLHPETKQGGDRKSKAKSFRVDRKSFAADTAKKIGTTDRSVQQYVQAASIDPAAKSAIRGTEAADSLTDLVRLARLEPAEQVRVAKRVRDEGETVKAATRQLKRIDQVAQIKVYRPPEGEFSVIVTDYPWKYDDALDGSDAIRGGCPYPPMEIDEICKFPLPAAKDCALFMCVTNSHLIDPDAYAVVARALKERYGFVPKQIQTWRKVTIDGTRDKFGGGHVWRNNTEHVVRFERGRPVFNQVTQTTCFDASLGEHSEKPQHMFDLISALCPGEPKLEMFARPGSTRSGWVTTGAELPPKDLNGKGRGEPLVPADFDALGKKMAGRPASKRRKQLLRWVSHRDGSQIANGRDHAWRVERSMGGATIFVAGEPRPELYATAEVAKRQCEDEEAGLPGSRPLVDIPGVGT